KTGVLSVSPLHGRTRVIPGKSGHSPKSFFLTKTSVQRHLIFVQCTYVVHIFNAVELHIFHADLLTLIDKRKSFQHKVNSCQKFFGCVAEILRANIMTYTSRFIMVFDDIGDHTGIADFFLCGKNTGFILFRIKVRPAVIPSPVALAVNSLRKIKHTGKISVFSDKISDLLRFLIENLSYRECVMRTEGFLSHLFQKFSDPLRLSQHMVDTGKAVRSVHRIIPERKFFLDIDDSVDADTSKSFIQPPVDIFIYFLPYPGIFPVQIRLLFMKYMKILFIRMAGKRFPHRAAEIASPVAGRPAVFPVFYIEKVSIFTVRILAGLLKPFMFV